MRKFLITFMFALSVVALPCKGAFAAGESGINSNVGSSSSDNIGYTGPVDIVTGQPIVEDEMGNKADIVTVSDGSTYDRENNIYKYTVGDGFFACTIADGMIVTGEVAMGLSGDENVDVYKDGKKYKEIPSTVSEPGSYVVVTWTDNSETRVMAFEIVAETTGSVNQYIMPDGFSVRSLYINGEEKKTNRSSVNMSEEGYYEVNYRCTDNNVDYFLEVNVDHTPPKVVFEGVNKNNKAKGPVTIKGLEEGDTVSVTYNGEESKLNYKNQLTQSGRYHVVVADEAGNTVEKTFNILIYLNIKSIVFLGLLLLVIVGVSVALIISRKSLRVR